MASVKTKKVLFASVLLLTGFGISQSLPRPRFEQLYRQGGEMGTAYSNISTYHDKESGQEFTCVYSTVYYGNSVSCFPTGRNWK